MKHAPIRELQIALGRLAPSQGRVARRNARDAVKKALKKVRMAMDRDYPAILKPRSAQPNIPLSPERWRARMRRRGYRSLALPNLTGVLANLAAAGVKVVVEKHDGTVVGAQTYWAPIWAVLAADGNTLPLLKRLKRDPRSRRAFLVEHAIIHGAADDV